MTVGEDAWWDGGAGELDDRGGNLSFVVLHWSVHADPSESKPSPAMPSGVREVIGIAETAEPDEEAPRSRSRTMEGWMGDADSSVGVDRRSGCTGTLKVRPILGSLTCASVDGLLGGNVGVPWFWPAGITPVSP